jgi:hypothetical protein
MTISIEEIFYQFFISIEKEYRGQIQYHSHLDINSSNSDLFEFPNIFVRLLFDFFGDCLPRENLINFLNIFRKSQYCIEEVFNILSNLRLIIKHVNYYNFLIKENLLYRSYDEERTMKYFNSYQNKKYRYLFSNFKTKPYVKEYNSFTNEHGIFFQDFNERRREISIDDKSIFY